MKVTHAGLFNRAAESYDFASIWAIEDACGRDLDAKVAEVQARMNYLAKYAAYVDFIKGY